MKKTGVLILAGILCVTALVGCGMGEETDSAFFGNYYLVGAKRGDLPVELADIGPGFTSDNMFCEFRSDGTFTFHSPKKKNNIIEGTFTVSGSEIIFKADEPHPPTTTIDGNKILMNNRGMTFILEKK